MSEQNLLATVYVYRNKVTGEIKAHYIDEAKIKEESIDWDHLATLEPRAWIENNYKDNP